MCCFGISSSPEAVKALPSLPQLVVQGPPWLCRCPKLGLFKELAACSQGE